MIKYKLIKEKLYHEDCGSYTAYGIAVYMDKILIRKISDISTSKKHVRALCRRCNANNLSPEHIHDVVADALSAC